MQYRPSPPPRPAAADYNHASPPQTIISVTTPPNTANDLRASSALMRMPNLSSSGSRFPPPAEDADALSALLALVHTAPPRCAARHPYISHYLEIVAVHVLQNPVGL